MSNRDKVFTAFAAIFILLVIIAGCNGGRNKSSEKVIKIGVAGPLAGDQADLASDQRNGVELAVDEANGRGGVNGYKFEVYALDDEHNPTKAVTVANRFVTDPNVAAVIGHLNSNATKAAEKTYNDNNVVQITASSTNPDLSNMGFKTFFRVCATDGVQATSIGTYSIKKLGLKKFVVLNDKTNYGQGLADAFISVVEGEGAKVVGHEAINQGESNYNSVLAKIKGLNPDGIFFAGMYAEGGQICKQARELGITAKYIGGDGLSNKGFIERAGDAANGTYCTYLAPDLNQVPSARKFVESYKKKYNNMPQTYAPYAYDAANIAIEAIKKAIKNSPRDKKISELRPAIVDYVRSTTAFKGVTGTINFDAKGDPQNQTFYIYTVENGQLKYLGRAL